MSISRPIDATNPAAQRTTIRALQDLVASSASDTERNNRQQYLDALLHVADAWQVLVRARKSATAKEIDKVAGQIFLSSWTGVAAEVFLANTPEKKQQQDDMEIDGAEEKAAEETIERARKDIAEAFDLLDEAEEEGTANARKIKDLGMDAFGESAFRTAMVEARVRRLERRDEPDA